MLDGEAAVHVEKLGQFQADDLRAVHDYAAIHPGELRQADQKGSGVDRGNGQTARDGRASLPAYDARSEMITDCRQSTASMVRARPAKRRKRARALLAPRVCEALEVGMLVPQPARSAACGRDEFEQVIEWTDSLKVRSKKRRL